MIINYIKPHGHDFIDAYEIDTAENTVFIYTIDSEFYFPLENSGMSGTYKTTPEKMGYKNMQEFINTLKSRYKGSLQEIPHDRQRAEEIAGLLRLAKFRVDNKYRFDDIPRRLCGYGLDEDYAEKIMRYYIEYGIERHTIKVTAHDGDTFGTEINGSVDEIGKIYTGLGYKSVEFLA